MAHRASGGGSAYRCTRGESVTAVSRCTFATSGSADVAASQQNCPGRPGMARSITITSAVVAMVAASACLAVLGPSSAWSGWVQAIIASLAVLAAAAWCLPRRSGGASVYEQLLPGAERDGLGSGISGGIALGVAAEAYCRENSAWVGDLLADGTYPGALPKTVQPLAPVLLSGASPGADTLFGEQALRGGHQVLHVLGPRNDPSDEAAQAQAQQLLRVDDKLLDGPVVSGPFTAAAKARGISKPTRHIPQGGANGTLDEWRDSRRNMLQVSGAQAVFAVAYRLNPSPQTPVLDIGGGTGLACQMYVDRFQPRGKADASACRLYFYDDGAPGWDGCLKDGATHRRWNRWDPLRSSWIPLEAAPPKPGRRTDDSSPAVYAGIGATRLDPEYGEKAIRALYHS